jgi:formylglycine-generating enzyme required for sulfatase activity
MVMACLAKEPEQRPQSARAVAEWIGLTIQEQRTGASLVDSVFGEAEPARVAAEQAGAEAAAEAPHTMSHRRKLLWLGGAVTAAVVLVLGGVWLLSTRFPHRGRKPTQEDRLVQGKIRTDARLQNLGLGQRWTNSLGMVFVPVPGTEARFSIWETRVQDFEAFVKATGRDMSGPMGGIKGSDAAGPSDGYSWHNPGFAQTSLHPVVGVTWHDARAFCAWLTRKEQEQGRLTHAQTYRLPTDAEWSRAVGQGKYPWGDTWPPPAGAGNYAGEEAKDADWPANSGIIAGYRDGFPRTAPVGNFAPNPYGLFDMGGNVWEWCEDVYRREMNLEEVRRKLPFFNDDGSSQKYRVLRGGSWFNDSWNVVLFCSFHHAHVPDSRDARVGFRVVLAGASSGSQP